MAKEAKKDWEKFTRSYVHGRKHKEINVGDIVRDKETKTKGLVTRVHQGFIWVRWEDGDYTQTRKTAVMKVLARPKGRLPNPHDAIKIYGRCLRIEAVKMRKHLYGGKPSVASQKYYHDFTTKNAIIYGLPDGSLLIKSKS